MLTLQSHYLYHRKAIYHQKGELEHYKTEELQHAGYIEILETASLVKKNKTKKNTNKQL